MVSTEKNTWRGLAGLINYCVVVGLFNATAVMAQAVSTGINDTDTLIFAQRQQSNDWQQQDYQTRSRSIDALLQAYRNIAFETGDSANMTAMEEHVTQTLENAKKKYQSGEYATGQAMLQRAYESVKQGIIGLRDGDTLVNKRAAGDQYDIKKSIPRHSAEYARLTNSLNTLMAAFQRVSEEKGQQPQASRLQEHVAEVQARADRLNRSGDHDSANNLLNGAYTLVRESLAALREGDTLVQSLNFANAKEEYQYYVRKIGSQREAIQILLSVSDDASKAKFINSLLQGTEKNLDEAGSLAADNNHAAAVIIMDKVFSRMQSGLMMSLSMR